MKKRKLLIIFIISLFLLAGINRYTSSRFNGTDDQGKAAIEAVSTGYKPWFEALWNSPSKPMENLLFGLQGAAGITFIAYFIGKKKNAENN